MAYCLRSERLEPGQTSFPLDILYFLVAVSNGIRDTAKPGAIPLPVEPSLGEVRSVL